MQLFVVFGIFLCLHAASAQIPVMNDGNDNTPISHLHYIASLQLATTEEQFFCAGVFISQKAVLTLASCFYQNDVLLEPEDVRVVGGSQFRLDKERNTFASPLHEILLHENFSRSTFENNLAIGYLLNTIPDDNPELVLDLEDIAFYSAREGAKCQIYGWSLTTRFEASPHLLSGEVEIETVEKCDVLSNKITSTTLCAGPYMVNGCETDDGSPLVCKHKLYGLVDYRNPGYCSMVITNRLGTYVDLSQFHDWIVEHSASRKSLLSGSLLVLSMIIIKSFK